LIRPLAFFLALLRSKLDRRSRLLIAWFGPCGLSSLLLVLVPVFAGVPGNESLFDICCLVVLLSVALHGGSLMLLRREDAPLLDPNRPRSAPPNANDKPDALRDGKRISVEDWPRYALQTCRCASLTFARIGASLQANLWLPACSAFLPIKRFNE